MIYSVEVKDKKIQLIDESKELTFKDWELVEGDLEQFICEHPEVLFDDETCILIGRHAVDSAKNINDLMAIDDNGNLILIELKRDKKDISNRSEALEFQAIRYCASLAKIESPEELVNASYARYLEKYDKNYKGELTPHERARKQLNQFLITNKCEDHFNKKQRIILVASDYDETTLSACAWLIKNGVDIKLVKISPQELNGHKQIEVSTVMPTKDESEYFLDLVKHEEATLPNAKSKIVRTNKPRMDKLIEWGIVSIGTNLFIKGYPDEIATIIDSKKVKYKGKEMSFNKWGCAVTGWTSICIYEWAVEVGKSETLDELRVEKMNEIKE